MTELLRDIRTIACPKCGCFQIIKEYVDVSNGKILQHVNGSRWEHRIFLCGQEISYIPNFRDEEISEINVCTHNHEYIQRKNLEERELNKLKMYIDTLELNPNKRKYIKSLV
jgi:hypothetical protein